MVSQRQAGRGPRLLRLRLFRGWIARREGGEWSRNDRLGVAPMANDRVLHTTSTSLQKYMNIAIHPPPGLLRLRLFRGWIARRGGGELSRNDKLSVAPIAKECMFHTAN